MLLLLKVHIGELKLGVLSLYTKLFRYWRGFLYLWLRRLSGVACENIRFSSLFARWGTLGARGLSCRLRPTKRSSPSHARKTSGTHNLGQNKMEQQTPIPPQIKDEGARRAKTRHFPILDLGGRGGLGFPFILSKIAGCRCEVSAQNVPSGEERRETDVSAGCVRGDVGLSHICVLLPNYKRGAI